MKNIVIACMAIFLAACSGDRSKPEFTATPQGVGPVQLGLTQAQLPASHTGLYDTISTETVEVEEMGDIYTETMLHFTLAGQPVMRATLFGQEIGSIEVVWPKVGSPEGICPGTPVEDFFNAGGKAQMYNDGGLHLILDKFEFGFAYDDLKEAAGMKLEQGYLTGEDPQIGADDFKGGAKITKILLHN